MDCTNKIISIVRYMHRKRKMRINDMDTKLNRCLSALELSFIGLSLMVSGIFVVTSPVVHSMAGPGIIVSYMLSGLAAMLSAFCYAEMGSRVPRTGSSYMYASIALGEIWGFLAGWNMILEYVLISSAMARSFTSTLVLAAGGENVTRALDTISFEVLGQRTDLVAAGAVVVFAIIVGLGVKLTIALNITFNVIAMLLVVVVSAFSIQFGNIENWNRDGLATFFPYGAKGVVAGAATTYFSYIGFEAITVSGEESVNPKRSIPLAILGAFLMATFCFVFSSLAFTYLTDASNFDPDMPLSDVFFNHKMIISAITISIGGMLSVCTNIIIGLYAVPRVFYAMAEDGLIFSWLGIINKHTQTPIYAVLVSSAMITVLTFLLDETTLVEAVSIGTLSSYILVAIGVIVLRFEPKRGDLEVEAGQFDDNETSKLSINTDSKPILDQSEGKIIPGQRKAWVKNHWFFQKVWPDVKPNKAIALMIFTIFLLAITEMIALKTFMFFSVWNLVLAIFLILPIFFWMLHLLTYDQSRPDGDAYQTPLMPLVPVISIWMNMQFMLMLRWVTWVRLVVWVTIGFIIYFSYGIHHSRNKEYEKDDNKPLNSSGQVIYGATHGTKPVKEYTEDSSLPSAASLVKSTQKPVIGDTLNNERKEVLNDSLEGDTKKEAEGLQ